MAEKATESSKVASSPTPRQLSFPDRTLPPALPLIISTQHSWNSHSCKLETTNTDTQDHHLQLVQGTLELLRSIDKPLAILSICGPYRSGKSYFMSRLLGSPGAFQLGHSMRACTQGIWMATTILECEEFATIFLDTEGIDAVGASETMAMSLLTLTTLLSSYLIYNSKKVPQKVDLDKMRCFSQLSTSLLAQRGDSMTLEAMKKFFPQFLWLLRDVHLAITDKEGKKITPTEFLHTRILASECGESTELGSSLCSLFPSLECCTLPVPSIKKEVIRNIVEQEDKLKPSFNTAINELIQQILQQVAPKVAIDGVSLVNGSTFVALACGYVEAINTPGALPNLEQGWQAVVRLQIKEYTDKLVREYEREMEESLKGILPLEERKLMTIHELTLTKKIGELQQEVHRINPLNSSPNDMKPLMSKLEQEIIKWNEPDNEAEREVVGGVLFQFTVQNYSKSKQHCEELLSELVKDFEVKDKVTEAVKSSKPLNVKEEIQAITRHYNEVAVGPAASEVMEKGLMELNQLERTLKMIPGCPQDVKVIGRGPDRIKLSWKPPAHNPEAAELYVVSMRVEGGAWEEVKRTKHTKALVTGLKSKKKYEFKLIATNSVMISLGNMEESETEKSNASRAAEGAAEGAALSTLFIGFELCDTIERKIRLSTATTAGIIAATLPLSLLIFPVTAPILTVIFAKEEINYSDLGDLTSVSEDEDI